MERQEVIVYSASRRGREQGIAESFAALVKHFPWLRHDRRWSYRSLIVEAAVVQGKVLDWNRGGFARRLKLHWECPQCRFPQWGDWHGNESNPCLWYSNCRCESLWLIEYSRPTWQSLGYEPAWKQDGTGQPRNPDRRHRRYRGVQDRDAG